MYYYEQCISQITALYIRVYAAHASDFFAVYNQAMSHTCCMLVPRPMQDLRSSPSLHTLRLTAEFGNCRVRPGKTFVPICKVCRGASASGELPRRTRPGLADSPLRPGASLRQTSEAGGGGRLAGPAASQEGLDFWTLPAVFVCASPPSEGESPESLRLLAGGEVIVTTGAAGISHRADCMKGFMPAPAQESLVSWRR